MKIAMNRKGLIAMAMVIALVLFFATSINLSTSGLPTATVIPGAEGVKVSNFGVQFGSTGAILQGGTADALPNSFKWMNRDVGDYTIQHDNTMLSTPMWILNQGDIDQYYENAQGQIRSEVEVQALMADNPITTPFEQVPYYKYEQLSNGSVLIRQVVLNLIPVDFTISISIPPGSGWYQFKDMSIWYQMSSYAWADAWTTKPPADPNPLTNSTTKYLSSNYRGAFPICAWIQGYQDYIDYYKDSTTRATVIDSDAPNHVILGYNSAGRYITLYSSPSVMYTIFNNQVLSSQAYAESALSPNNLPSPEFGKDVWFKIYVDDLGPYVRVTSTNPILGTIENYDIWYPAVNFRIRAVYAVYGEYVYLWTAQRASQTYSYTGWQTRTPITETHTAPPDIFSEIGDFLSSAISSPITWIETGAFAIMLVVVVLVVFLFRKTGPSAYSRREAG